VSRGLSRRSFLGRAAGTGLGGVVLLSTPATGDEDGEEESEGSETETSGISGTVVVVTLVGGLDALSVVVPHDEPDYYRLRPSIAIRPPGEPNGAIPFVDGFGLHPAFAPLINETRGAGLAFVKGVGLIDAPRSRSHRASLDGLQRPGGEQQGFAAALLAGNDLSAASAWWFGPDRHRLFRGLPGAVGGRPALMLSPYRDASAAHRALGAAFEEGGPLAAAARAALTASARWSGVGWNATGTPSDRGYPPSDFGDSLAGIADMLRFDEGLRLVAVDQEGYDTHRRQGDGSGGVLAARLDELARGLRSFWSDLGLLADAVSVVVVSEFGRTVHENRRGGTNHGRGGVAMVLDQAVRPGIHRDQASGGEGLRRGASPVTTSVHQVLAEVFERRGWSGLEVIVDEGDERISGLGLYSSRAGVDPAT